MENITIREFLNTIKQVKGDKLFLINSSGHEWITDGVWAVRKDYATKRILNKSINEERKHDSLEIITKLDAKDKFPLIVLLLTCGIHCYVNSENALIAHLLIDCEEKKDFYLNLNKFAYFLSNCFKREGVNMVGIRDSYSPLNFYNKEGDVIACIMPQLR